MAYLKETLFNLIGYVILVIYAIHLNKQFNVMLQCIKINFIEIKNILF